MEKKFIEEILQYYIGADVEFGYDNNIKNGKLSGKSTSFGWEVTNYSNVFVPYFHVRTELIKLKLRSLSDMTEDEAHHFAWLCLNTRHHLDEKDKATKDEIDFELVKNDGGLMLDDDVEIYINCDCRCWEGAVLIKKDGSILLYDVSLDKYKSVDDVAFKIHYLLTRSFDLFGLIPAGIALEQENPVER